MSEFVFLFPKNTKRRSLYTPCKVEKVTKHSDPDLVCEQKDFDVDAQWDTGAQITTISHSLIDRLGLESTGAKTVLYGVGGETDSEFYNINIRMPGGIFIRNLRVAVADYEDTAELLIGMDVILKSDFILLDAPDYLRFGFRYPGIGSPDFTCRKFFVPTHEQRMKMNPNDRYMEEGNPPKRIGCLIEGSSDDYEKFYGKEEMERFREKYQVGKSESTQP